MLEERKQEGLRDADHRRVRHDGQLAVVSQFTGMVADAAGDPALAGRTWVLLTQAVPGGWGLWGHANTNDELAAAARKQIAELQAKAAGPAS